VSAKIVRTPGWVSYRRERSEKREKRDHEHKGRRNTGTGGKKRCRKRSRTTVDGATIWPNQRVVHNRPLNGYQYYPQIVLQNLTIIIPSNSSWNVTNCILR
jgi:hypothetical protein